MSSSEDRPSAWLTSNPEAYDRSFNSFKAARKDNAAIRTCIEEHILPAIRSAIMSESTPFRVLSVGSGSGENDVSFLESLTKLLFGKKSSKKLLYRVIEPYESSLSAFRAKAQVLSQKWGSFWEDIEFQWVPMTFQRYAEQKKQDDVKFDVIHFIHSIYHVGLEAALEHCYKEELGEKGAIISITNRGDSALARYKEKFSENRIISELKIDYITKDVIAVAKRSGWKFVECSGESEVLDITEIFDWSSEEGGRLLDFLSNFLNVRLAVSHETLEKVLNFWKEESSVDDHGRNIVKQRIGAVIISK